MRNDNDSLFVPESGFKGIRIEKIEIYNWGPFHDVHTILLDDGRSLLLVGANSTGKSTVLDAVKMIFVSNPKFNEAAASKDNKRSVDDRSLGSLVLGQYCAHTESSSNVPIPDLGRSVRDISIVSCTFAADFGKHFTAMVLFHYSSATPEVKVTIPRPISNYFMFEREISLQKDVLGPLYAKGGQIEYEYISRFLRSIWAKSYQSFSNYSIDLAARLNVSVAVLPIIASTISKRSLSNVDDFIRNKTLISHSTAGLLTGLQEELDHIRALNDLVITSERKRDVLVPLIKSGKEYNEAMLSVNRFTELQDGCENWIDGRFFGILSAEKESLYDKYTELESETKKIEIEIEKKNSLILELSGQMRENGSERLAELKRELKLLEERVRDVSEAFKAYRECLKNLSLALPEDEDEFNETISVLKEKKEQYINDAKKLGDTLYNLKVQSDRISERLNRFENDYSSIRNTESNIPPALLAIRSRMERDLAVAKGTFKYVGELIEVKAEECKDWEGPINNLMYSFALQLLIPVSYRNAVRKYLRSDMKDWVKRPRDAYIRFLPVKDLEAVVEPTLGDNTDTVFGKLVLKVGEPMTKFLKQRIVDHFSHKCVESLDIFGDQKVDALEKSGLYMLRNNVNIKDDRKDIRNSSWYVLGFSNERKRQYYISEIAEYKDTLNSLNNEKKRVEREIVDCNNLLEHVRNALTYKKWSGLDVAGISKERKIKQKEFESYRDSTTILDVLEKKLNKAKEDLNALTKKKDKNMRECGNVSGIISNLEERLSVLNIEEIPQADADYYNSIAYKFRPDGELKYSEEADFRKFMKVQLNQETSSAKTKVGRLKAQVLKQMDNYKQLFNDDMNLYVAIECLQKYESLYETLVEEGLSMTKEINRRFKMYVVDGLITFSEQLDASSKDIYTEIDDLNKVLGKIYFDIFKGEEAFLHVRLDEKTGDATEEFRKNLKKTLQNVRFGKASQEDCKTADIISLITPLTAITRSESDRRADVTDVRNWFTFSLELVNRDKKQLAFYKSSNSLSTGTQDAMCAFIMLVSLANIYGFLNSSGNECFRLVMMDEAFHNNSSDKIRRVFQLLKELDFQLIFVTPEIKSGELLRSVQVIYQVYGNLPDDLPGHSYLQKHEIREYAHFFNDDADVTSVEVVEAGDE